MAMFRPNRHWPKDSAQRIWDATMDGTDDTAPRAFETRLETEGLVVLAGAPFVLSHQELDLVSPRYSDGRAKSISLGPDEAVRGAAADPEATRRLRTLMTRYRTWAEALIADTAPSYAAALERGRTSLRTREVADGAERPRKDDRRLHVDAFASQPTGGRRILRVFTNINPLGEDRLWRVGEPFEAHARRWVGQVRRPWPGEAWLLRRLGVTRSMRTPYDALMLGLHDAAKLDEAYQRSGSYREVACAILNYRRGGISQFLLQGSPDQREMEHFCGGVLPLIRAGENS